MEKMDLKTQDSSYTRKESGYVLTETLAKTESLSSISNDAHTESVILKVWNFANKLETQITHWLALNRTLLLRVSLGIVYIWFGGLKYTPELSPATPLVIKTFDILTFHLIPKSVSSVVYMPFLATWECVIGVGLIIGKFRKTILLLAFVHLLGTMTPLFILSDGTFRVLPFAPTLFGQYIIKNLVFFSALFAIWSDRPAISKP